MPGIPPNAFSLLKSKIKGLVKNRKKDNKAAESAKPVAAADTPTEVAASQAATDTVAAAAPDEATKTTEVAPATAEAVAETKVEEPVAATETKVEEPAAAPETTAVKEDTIAEPASPIVADSESAPKTEIPVEKSEKPSETAAPTETAATTVAA